MTARQPSPSTSEMQSFPRDGAPPLRARVVEAQRRVFHGRDGLRADYALWRRARAGSGWVVAVEITRSSDGASWRSAFDGHGPELLSALEAWRPAGPQGLGADAASSAKSKAAGCSELETAQEMAWRRLQAARLHRFLAATLGETLHHWRSLEPL